ncbi:hypothetical protein AB1Y20_002585 [Prymnesium parvum]|uniref:Uncharacterized protein n=1 Tax=Prymnesium parvum TaxID=97485 RepID=A0AB34JC81_PRYPA
MSRLPPEVLLMLFAVRLIPAAVAGAWPCPPESVFTQPRGNFSLGPFSTGRQSVECHYVWSAGAQGLTLRFLSFDLGGGRGCDDDDATVRIYDGSTRLAPMLGLFSCDKAWSVASSTGAMLLTFAAPQRISGAGFAVVWEPSTGECGNGICEPGVHDEYDRCSADCQRELPKFEEQYTDRKWCERFDTMTATASSGQSMEVEYTAATFGTKIPESGLSLSIASVTPENACSTITSVTHGGSWSPHVGGGSSSFAALASIYGCHFLDKALNAEKAGAALLVVLHFTSTQLFYMAAADGRQAGSRSLDIPSLLIGEQGSQFLWSHSAEGVELRLGHAQRCSGGKFLTSTRGSLQSTPPGMKYCNWQDCMWHISLQHPDIIILTFSRFDLECIVGPNGAYDYVKVYDGATPRSEELASMFCVASRTIVSSGPNLLVHFHSDELYNFNGFAANYVSGEALCSPISDCGECTTNTWCSWCRSSERCVPNAGPKALCSDGKGWPLDAPCCPAGRAGADCERCAANHYGATCTACDCSTVGGVCGDGLQGDGVCTCKPGFSGATCDVCKQGYWGAECSPCNCSGSSYCDEGLSGTGCVCNANHFGPSCEACTCVGDEICADGAAGDGTCSCPPFYTGPGCSECTAGRWGAQCNQCDCPASTKCDEGISGTGQCRCTSLACESDATVSFLQLIVAKTLVDPAPNASDRVLLYSSHQFDHSNISGSAVYEFGSPSDVEALDLAFAMSQWNARVQVSVRRAGEESFASLCSFELSANQTARLDEAVDILNDEARRTFASNNLTLFAGTDLLLRTCRFHVGIGSNHVRLSTISPSGQVSGEYNLLIKRPLSEDCSLSELSFLILDADCSVPAECVPGHGGSCAVPQACQHTARAAQYPGFSATVLQYFVAIDASVSALMISADSSHGARCAGKYNQLYDVNGTYSRGCNHSTALRYVSEGYEWPAVADSLRHLALPPEGRSYATLMIDSESGLSTCSYNITISRGASSDAVLQSLTLQLVDSSTALLFANASRALDDVIEFEPPPLEHWVLSFELQLDAHSASGVVITCPANVTCHSSRRLLSSDAPHRRRVTISDLPIGRTTVKVEVTAEDLVHKLNYRIILRREASSECKLNTLRVYRACNPPCQEQLLEEWETGIEPGALSLQVENTAWDIYLVATAVHSGTTLQMRILHDVWQPLALDAPSEDISLPVGQTAVSLRSTSESSAECFYVVLIDRPRSPDVSLASVNAQVVVGGESLGRVVPLISPSSLAGAKCNAYSCFDLILNNEETTVVITAIANHSIQCRLKSHVCAASTSMNYSELFGVSAAPSSSGELAKNGLQLVARVVAGVSSLTIELTAEDGTTARHIIYILREASSDTSLSSLSLQGGFAIESLASGLEKGSLHIVMSESSYRLFIFAVPSYLGATVTIEGVLPPAEFQIRASLSTLTVLVVAENKRDSANISLVVRCSHCQGDTSGRWGDPDPPRDPRVYVSSVWLVLVILSITLLLCGLSLGVCIRMHRMRIRRRQGVHEASGLGSGASNDPERILAAMEPFLVEVKSAAQSLSEDSCAICLGELELEGNLTMLPCSHIFHSSCIRGWLVHKGMAAYCPLCKYVIQNGTPQRNNTHGIVSRVHTHSSGVELHETVLETSGVRQASNSSQNDVSNEVEVDNYTARVDSRRRTSHSGTSRVSGSRGPLPEVTGLRDEDIPQHT